VRDHISDAELALILEALRELGRRKMRRSARIWTAVKACGFAIHPAIDRANRLQSEGEALLELADDLAELETP
jgi:sulfite reductase beta subunit-like hemoprotein